MTSSSSHRPVADALVVGAGPAGSATAILLARAGWRVRLVDRDHFPRPKPCGEFVNPGAVRLLRRLGLSGVVSALPRAPIAGWTIRSAGGRSAVGRYGPSTPPGLGIRRLDLDAALVRTAASEGVRVGEGVRVSDVEAGGRSVPPRVVVGGHDDGSRRLAARVVVGADGLRSTVARRLDLVAGAPGIRKASLTCHVAGEREGSPPEVGLLHLGTSATLGVAPLRADGTLWNVTLVVRSRSHGRALARDARSVFRRALEGRGGPWTGGSPEIVAGPWASGPFDRPTRAAWRGRVVLVGDAAGYYDPLTGEGIHRALLSAALAADAVDRVLAGDAPPEAAFGRYDRGLRRRLGPSRRVQRIVEGVVARPGLLEGAMTALARSPSAAGRLLGVTGDALPVRALASPRFWIPFVGAAVPAAAAALPLPPSR